MNYGVDVIIRTAEEIKQRLLGESTGHDWWHVQRVWQMAKVISREEGADLFIVELAALLHDIADWKFHGGDDKASSRAAREWLTGLTVDATTISRICEIIDDLSFKGAGVQTSMKTKEGMVVQDADRLDAIGAIGIARAFAYGGHKGQELHNPDVAPIRHTTSEQYKNSKSTTINHFSEKLLLLKDLMNTETARRIAAQRHEFMAEYLNRFLLEADGRA